MPMDRETIARLERLARIELTPEERERFVGELGRIVEYAGELDRADEERVMPPPGAGSAAREAGTGADVCVSEGSAGLRTDEPGRCLGREAALGAAPDTDGRKELFRVPRVLPE